MKKLSIILISLGVLLFLVGYLFKVMHWPDLFNGIYSGPIFICLGFLFLFISIRKN